MTDESTRATRSFVLRVLLRGIAAFVVVCVVMAAVWCACWYLGLIADDPAFIRARRARWGVVVIGSELLKMIEEGLPVPGSVGEIIAHAKAWRDSDSMIGVAEIDPWGSPYFFEVVSDRKFCVEDCLKCVVRSFGPNRRDDLGKADDIQTIGQAWPSRAERRNKPADAARQQ